MRPLYFLLFSILTNVTWSQSLYDYNRHNSAMNSGWVSCTPAENPNNSRGVGHWIMYDFQNIYQIENTHFWNLNDNSLLAYGMSEYTVDISTDGQNWTEVGTYNMDMANGSSFYMGQPGPSFEKIRTRFVLITALDNHGGSCYGFSEVKFGISQAVLPVTLVDQFTSCNESTDDHTVKWITENEINNDKYILYRSFNGEDWSKIGQIAGRNNENQEIYTFTDKTTKLQEVYYQIKQHDFDGNITTFEVMKSTCGIESSNLQIAPNPVNETLFFTYNLPTQGPLQFSITEMSGKIIFEKTIDSNSWKGAEQIQISDLPSGLYIFNLIHANHVISKKFQKL